MLRSILQYVELTPRIRGKKSFLLVKSDYDSMISAESISTAFRRLEGTKYRPYISQLLMGEFDLGKTEENLTKAYQDEFNFVLSKLKNKKAKEFFEEFNRYYELKCLASILKSIILGVKWEEALKYVTPFGKIDLSTCKSLIEGKNVKNVLQLIQEKLLVRELEKTMKEIEDPSKQTQKLELVITKHAFTKIWEKLLQLKGRDKLCIKLVGINVDMLNIMTVLRLKKLELKPEEIEAYIIPVYHLLNEKDVKRAISATTEKDSIKVFVASRYVDVISPLTGTYEVREDLSVFEIALKRYHARECERVFYQPFFHLGEALAYLYLKWYEVKDLIAIIAGKYFGLTADKIEYSLVLHQPPHPV